METNLLMLMHLFMLENKANRSLPIKRTVLTFKINKLREEFKDDKKDKTLLK